ncbi:MAG: Chromosomal replication initiator protein DnaA [bacterium ADurb.Bin236]|nr:MAG: Chromosomal replication initiator protein DnaA [bacterium ADurb.Bin236]HOY61662.1 chromosomal replication initiator protein DnaA [bacterium]
MSLDDIWKKTVEALESKINHSVYMLLIKQIAPVSLDESTLYLKIPGTMSMSYLAEHKEEIEEAVSEILGIKIDVVAIQDESPETIDAKASRKQSAALEKPAEPPHPSRIGAAPHLNPKYTFDNFVRGSTNQIAYSAARAVAEAPGNVYNPLFFYGGVGIGKTHLMQAIGHYIASTRPNLIIAYKTTNWFIHEFTTSIRENRMHDFRNHYHKIDVLLLDDIQFIEGKEATQEEFHQIFNDFYERKKQVVLTCDRPPKDLPKIEDRIISRLSWGLVCDIQQPDFETRVSIIRNKLDIEGNYLPEDIINYIAEYIRTDIRMLEGALNRLFAYSKVSGKEINLESAERIIKDISPESKKEAVTVQKIVKIVANHYNLDAAAVLGKSRKKELALARSVAMYLAYDITKLPQSSIGNEFSGRDHSTVIYSLEKIRSEMESDPEFKKTIQYLKDRITG